MGIYFGGLVGTMAGAATAFAVGDTIANSVEHSAGVTAATCAHDTVMIGGMVTGGVLGAETGHLI